MFYLRMALGLAGFLVSAVYGVAIAVLRRDRAKVAHDYAQMLARVMQPLLGLRVEVEGREHLLAHRPCIYIANHQSVYDVPILAGLYPPDTVVIAKKEIRSIPFFGWLYAITGNILIDRAHNQSAVGRLREAEEAILSRRVSVWIFPEGTRATVPGELLPFKKGAFYMAVATGAPLVPVVVSPIRPLFDPKRRIARAGRVRVRVLEPIPTRGLSEADIPALISNARARMQASLNELAAPVPRRRVSAH